MVAFNLRFYLLLVFITWEMTIISAQFGVPFGGGQGFGGIGSNFGQNSFSSQNTNFNQNRRGFGIIAGFGGSSSTNFNQNSIQSSQSGGSVTPFFREDQGPNTNDEMHARYASPYDVPQYTPNPVVYPAPSLCPTNGYDECALQVIQVPCPCSSK